MKKTDFEYDFIVYIGRFQPFHNGHAQTIRSAFQKARRVLLLVGSHQAARSTRNPWTSEERRQMIRATFPSEPVNGIEDKLIFAELEDFTYNDNAWIARVQEIVAGFRAIYGNRDSKIGITGFDKDSSSYYLKAFPQWDFVATDSHEVLNATEMRHFYFDTGTILTGKLPKGTATFMNEWAWTPEYKALKREFHIVKKYKESWSAAPYPPIFVTTDAVVVQAGHILLVKRGGAPGEGLWALPGGFVNPDETLLNSCIRELKEETKIKCPVAVLKGSIKGPSRTFDDPNRSTRGRTITEGFLFNLEARPEGLYKVKGSDDAVAAKWVTISEFNNMRDQLFEDHFHVATFFLGRI
jgi:bifunctional NMN adenylyltransferase/nudix hydrolase